MISLSTTQRYGFQKIMDFIKTDQLHLLQFLIALLKPNFPSQIAAFAAVSKTQKMGELMRYLGPLRILQTHKTIPTRTVSKPGISLTTLTNGCTLRHG